MHNPIITIGFDKNGDADFGISGTIGDLDLEMMKELRAMIPVAIGVAEDMWKRAKERERPAAQQAIPKELPKSEI